MMPAQETGAGRGPGRRNQPANPEAGKCITDVSGFSESECQDDLLIVRCEQSTIAEPQVTPRNDRWRSFPASMISGTGIIQ
jgi:hypothetical protein